MASAESFVRLRHGTTRQRAEAILRKGPDPNFREPGGPEAARGLSTARLHGPYPFGTPEGVAANKAALFPNEGGPAIIEMDVPEDIVRLADIEGEVRFEPGFGLEELLAVWAALPKRILLP